MVHCSSNSQNANQSNSENGFLAVGKAHTETVMGDARKGIQVWADTSVSPGFLESKFARAMKNLDLCTL